MSIADAEISVPESRVKYVNVLALVLIMVHKLIFFKT
jgi:hypothetical protein